MAIILVTSILSSCVQATNNIDSLGSQTNIGSRWLSGLIDPLSSQGIDGDLFLNESTGHVFVKRNSNWIDIANITGAAGNPGLDGNTWLLATSDPSVSEGDSGDLYLNTTNSDIFQKDNGVWVKIGSLQSSVWLNGNTNPSSTLGKINDFYLDTITTNIYIKDSSGWNLLGSLFISNSFSEYSVTLSATSHGNINAYPTSAKPGAIIDIVIEPENGFTLKNDSLKYNDGSDHLINNEKFIMPSTNVTVSAVFEEIRIAKFVIEYSIDNGLTYSECTDYSYIPTQGTYWGYLVPSLGLNYVRLKNTGNTTINVKVRRNSNIYNGYNANWEYGNAWETIDPGLSSTMFTDSSGQNTRYYFLIDILGASIDSSMSNDFVFRNGTSVIISEYNAPNIQLLMVGVK